MILGACRPPLTLAALTAEPSIGPLLPCNVVVRAATDSRTLVEALDPMLSAPSVAPSVSDPQPNTKDTQPWSR